MTSVQGRPVVAGEAEGPVLRLDEPLSLWGGVDPTTAVIVDPRHPQAGASIAGRVITAAACRGSSSSSSVLVELARVGLAPAGFVLGEPDEVLVIGAVVADELYGASVPVVVLDDQGRAAVASSGRVAIDADGSLSLAG